MPEKVLDYPRSTVPQETGWWCGPASVQILASARGKLIPEPQIAAAIEEIENPGRGDDKDGTDWIGLLEIYLDRILPEARYTTVLMQTDPPTKAQRDKLFFDVINSINAGYGVVANIVAPPFNKPSAVKGSVAPPYPRSVTTFHYLTIMGYDADERAVWIADPAAFGGVTGWWSPLEGPGSISSLIPPKGYCFAAAAPIPAQTKPQPSPQPAPALRPQPISVDLTAADYLALTYGDRDAIAVLVRSAKTDSRAARALSRLEQVNPAALQSYLRG